MTGCIAPEPTPMAGVASGNSVTDGTAGCVVVGRTAAVKVGRTAAEDDWASTAARGIAEQNKIISYTGQLVLQADRHFAGCIYHFCKI